MPSHHLNSGIIYTNADCIGCNKCISGCNAVGANVVVKAQDGDRYLVLVDPEKCILCGMCVESCVHHARTYRDDTDAFFEALEHGESISLLVSPTLLTDYEKLYHNILGYFKHLGVNHIYNTSFGGDLMIWVYMNFIQKFGLAGVISQFCPVIVNYLEKYKPELLAYLMPVQSSLMCTAIYAHDYLKNEDKLAFISPCIATKYEIEDVNTYGRVSYNVTFERLMKRLREVDISAYYADDEVSYGLGALISMPGGLSDNIERYIGFDEVLIQTTGPTNIFPYFDHYCKEVSTNKDLPFLVDSLSCTNGCNFSTGTQCGVELRNEVTYSAHRVKERAYRSGNVATAFNYEERLNLLNKRFQDFELSSFVRQYDSTRQVKGQELTEDEFQDIYLSMYKFTYEHRHTDCGACGYQTCRDMAIAIGTNVNHKENCINYAKECIRIETEKTNQLLEAISSMNEELKKSTQLKSNFLANMSHEIRTPMNAIIGMAEMALRGELPAEERSYIQQIKASGRSLLAIINDILDFSKIESGKMEINETKYEVMSLISDTVNIIMTRIGEKDITLMVDVDPTIPVALYGDDIRIKQVLVNFANNAVKFTDSGFVKVSLCYEKGEEDQIFLTVSIQDTGIGIKTEDQAKLFNSFQQVDSKRNRNVEGTGLGLAISRELVLLMHGSINVESTYGVGSAFSFRIPQRVLNPAPCVSIRAPQQVKVAAWIQHPYVLEGYLIAVTALDLNHTECASIEEVETAVEQGAAYVFVDYAQWDARMDAFARNHRQVQVVIILDVRQNIVSVSYVRKVQLPAYCLNIAAVINHESLDGDVPGEEEQDYRFEAPDAQILIVDDNAINLTVAKGLLSPLRMNVDTASGAREAIAMLEQKRYDIVFMDHMMPDIDGVEATHMIREMEGDYYRELPIIALTANAINNAREMFIMEGMNDFVAKPVEMMDITAKLRKWLPAEKIKTIYTHSAAAQSADSTLQIEGLDVRAGLQLSGSEEVYLKILADFYEVIEKKAAAIERDAAEEHVEAYTIEVHALKSAAKLIGANELSELAADLEKNGHCKELEPIRALTPQLVSKYRAFIPILEPYKRKQAAVVRRAVTKEELAAQLDLIYDALDNFDLDEAQEVMARIDGFQLEELEEMREKLREALASLEYDDAEAIAQEWRGNLATV